MQPLDTIFNPFILVIHNPLLPTKNGLLVCQNLYTTAFYIALLRANKASNDNNNNDNSDNDNEITAILSFAINFTVRIFNVSVKIHTFQQSLYVLTHVQNWYFPASPLTTAESTNFYHLGENSYFSTNDARNDARSKLVFSCISIHNSRKYEFLPSR